MKSIEIIGEAAARVTQDTRNRFQQIPWADIVGMRNRLIDVYFETDIDLVWQTVTKDLPELIIELEKALENS